MIGEIIFAFATIFGPANLDPFNPNSSMSCAREVFGRPRAVNTAIFAVASYKHLCGERLRICYGNRCVVARVLDRGPRRARLSGPYTDDLDLSVALARALGISNARGQSICKRAHRRRGCSITYTVEREQPFVNYHPPRS